MIDKDVFFIQTRIKGIQEELRMIEEATNRIDNKKDKLLVPEELVDQILSEIQVKTEGFVPVKWRKKGSTEWKECIYTKRK